MEQKNNQTNNNKFIKLNTEELEKKEKKPIFKPTHHPSL